MTNTQLTYGPSVGPLGFPMTDRQAQSTEAIMKSLPKDPAYAYRKAAIGNAASELLPGERADVSWISTEDPDRAGDVVLSAGMDDSQFKLNPIVTMQHAYWLPPVGKSQWRKRVKDGERRGIKAKTVYPVKPADWTNGAWPPDVAFQLVQSDLMRGKSIGFLPLKVHEPTDRERERNGWTDVKLVIDQWLLLEYACCYLPTQQNAVVETVSKEVAIPDDFLKALGIGRAEIERTFAPWMPFTTLAEFEKALERQLAAVPWSRLGESAVRDPIDRLRGRV